MRHNRWIGHAQKLAKTSEFWPYKMACVLIRGGSVISRGVNKTSPGCVKDARYTLNRSTHAELAAVTSVDSVEGCIAYVAGISKGDKVICSKPCPLCQDMFREAGIKRVYYHDREGKLALLSL